MKAAIFATKLRALKPGRKILSEKGLPEAFIEELRASYDILPKEEQRGYDAELAKLANNYTIKGYELFGITFTGQTIRKNGRLTFATMELDELSIDERDGRVKLFSFETEKPIFECAANSEAFLDALYDMAKIVAARIQREKFSDPCTDAVRLAELADLPASEAFYRWVLGCEQDTASKQVSAAGL